MTLDGAETVMIPDEHNCGLSPAPVRSNRGDDVGLAKADMGVAPDRVWVDWEAEFRSAIVLSPVLTAGVVRDPEWYVLRFTAAKAKLLTRLIGLIRLPYHHLTYVHCATDTRRAWFPGHLFVEFDIGRDYWQQMLRMPGALSFLGGPTGYPKALPVGLMPQLVERLPDRISTAVDRRYTVAPGQRVRISKGAFQGHEGTVAWSGRKHAGIMAMMFGCPREIKVDHADIQVIG